MGNFEYDKETWRQLCREDRGRADEFYYANIFPEVVNRFKNQNENLQRYRFLISLLGFSPQPIILFISAIRPERVVFLYSGETEPLLDDIGQRTGLQISQIEKAEVDSSDVTKVYKAIKQFVAAKDPEDIFIDITGGKKSMVGGAALAGYILNLTVGYVDYKKYLPDLRQPEPGTEYPNILRNPLVVFGDLEIVKAREFFNQGHFIRALEIAESLETRTPDVWPARELKDLIQIYQAWDKLDFASALNAARNFLARHEYHTDSHLLESVRRHMAILEILSDPSHSSNSIYLALSFFFTGKRLAIRQRYDMAVLLMYRTIEQILSTFLKEEKGIDPSFPKYPAEFTQEAYNQKLREIYDKQYYAKDLPDKLGLMDQAIVLSMLGHRIVKGMDFKKLKGIVELRNSCIFAHGAKIMNKEDWGRFRRLAAKLLQESLEIKNDQPLHTYEQFFSFPELPYLL